MPAVTTGSTASGSSNRGPSLSQPELDVMIAAARGGSTQALDQLIEVLAIQLWNDLHARPRRSAGPSHGSSDLVQDTLIRVREQFAKFERDTFADFKQWARAILYRRHLEWTRNHQSRSAERHQRRLWTLISMRSELSRLSQQEQAVELRESLQIVDRAYQTLKATDQFIIDMRLDGLSFREIADLTESKVDAVTKAYHRAIARLRKKLGNDEA